jgi:hypothetical protein
MSLRSDVLGYFVPQIMLSQIFSELLLLPDICQFDTAMCNKNRRLSYLECIESESCVWLGDKDRDLSFDMISWLYTRSIKIRHLKCNRISDDKAIKVYGLGNSLHWLSIRDTHMIDESFIKIIEGCPNLESIELLVCSITDLSIIMLADCCPSLRSIDLTRCYDITDASIVRLAERCPNLESLTLSGCDQMTDRSITKV